MVNGLRQKMSEFPGRVFNNRNRSEESLECHAKTQDWA